MNSFVVMMIIFLLIGMIGSAGKQGSQPRRRPGTPWNPPGSPPRRVVMRELLGEPWLQNMPRVPASPQAEQETGDPGTDTAAVEPPVLARKVQPEAQPDGAGNRIKAAPGPGGGMDTALTEAALERSGETGRASLADKAAFELTAENLVQGVIWAEVLGRPRALRPFHGPRT